MLLGASPHLPDSSQTFRMVNAVEHECCTTRCNTWAHETTLLASCAFFGSSTLCHTCRWPQSWLWAFLRASSIRRCLHARSNCGVTGWMASWRCPLIFQALVCNCVSCLRACVLAHIICPHACMHACMPDADKHVKHADPYVAVMLGAACTASCLYSLLISSHICR